MHAAGDNLFHMDCQGSLPMQDWQIIMALTSQLCVIFDRAFVHTSAPLYQGM